MALLPHWGCLQGQSSALKIPLDGLAPCLFLICTSCGAHDIAENLMAVLPHWGCLQGQSSALKIPLDGLAPCLFLLLSVSLLRYPA